MTLKEDVSSTGKPKYSADSVHELKGIVPEEFWKGFSRVVANMPNVTFKFRHYMNTTHAEAYFKAMDGSTLLARYWYSVKTGTMHYFQVMVKSSATGRIPQGYTSNMIFDERVETTSDPLFVMYADRWIEFIENELV